jgi:hypothetical protein
MAKKRKRPTQHNDGTRYGPDEDQVIQARSTSSLAGVPELFYVFKTAGGAGGRTLRSPRALRYDAEERRGWRDAEDVRLARQINRLQTNIRGERESKKRPKR